MQLSLFSFRKMMAGMKTIEVCANKYNFPIQENYVGPVTFVADDKLVKRNIVRITW